MQPGRLSFIIIGTQDDAIARQQCDAAIQALVPQRELYTIIYGDGKNGDRIDAAKSIYHDKAMMKEWLDCEADGTGLDATNAPENIGACVSQLDAAPEPWDVYTNGGFWSSAMAGQSAVLVRPRGLWIASWLPGREPTAEDFLGWGTSWPSFGDGYLNAPMTWQYDHDIQLQTPYGIVFCDLDARYYPESGLIHWGIDVSNYAGMLNPDALAYLVTRPDLPAEQAPTQEPPGGTPEGPSSLSPAPVWLSGGVQSDGLPRGLMLNGWQLGIFNGPAKPVLMFGDESGEHPGRIAKLFGDSYMWLRKGSGPDAYWSAEEGD